MRPDIHIVFTDCDGVLTDNRVYVQDNGCECLAFHKADGLAVKILRDRGIKVVMVTGEMHCAAVRRAEKLQVECWQLGGSMTKMQVVDKVLEREHISWENVAYLGNDDTDWDCLYKARLGIVPYDHMVTNLLVPQIAGLVVDDQPPVNVAKINALAVPGGAGVLYASLSLLTRR